jgi:predicted PurR-regulated permease PerM
LNNKSYFAPDITRTTLAILSIVILAAASFWVLRPFLTAFLWASMIVIATWPILLAVQNKLWGRRGIAVAFMISVLLLILIVPFSFSIATIIDKADDATAWAKSLAAITVPGPPSWLEGVPFFGPKLSDKWQQIASLSPAGLSDFLTPYLGKGIRWFVAQVGNAGFVILEFLLTVIITAILYANGEMAGSGIKSFARRLAGEKGDEVVSLAGKAIRGVALGVVVTAIIQASLGGIGLAIVGIPAAAILTAVMFILCIAQLGPALVMIPAIIWVYFNDGAVWCIVLIVWTIPVLAIDNFLRPVLIRKGADLPLLLIFAGVIGGLLALGIIGLFIGPVVLAVTYTLIKSWVSGDPQLTENTLAAEEEPQSTV